METMCSSVIRIHMDERADARFLFGFFSVFFFSFFIVVVYGVYVVFVLNPDYVLALTFISFRFSFVGMFASYFSSAVYVSADFTGHEGDIAPKVFKEVINRTE